MIFLRTSSVTCPGAFRSAKTVKKTGPTEDDPGDAAMAIVSTTARGGMQASPPAGVTVTEARAAMMPSARRFSGPAANALELTATEAIGMQHNYIGCEHLLVALALEPDGAAGAALRALGADARAVRRTVSAAVAGYAHLRAQNANPGEMLAAAVRKEIEPLIRRIERLESSASGEEKV
jgi:hypothetical protein